MAGKVFGVLLFLLLVSSGFSASWELTFRDDFSGRQLDAGHWNRIEGGGGFGNRELQYYSGRPENVFLSNGFLVLRALKEDYRDHGYTSAKLTTQHKVFWTYGKFEIRAKLPQGQGLWPAFWMMPEDWVPFWESTDISGMKYGGWPSCGEIDIMECRGQEADRVIGSIHYGEPHGYASASFRLPEGKTFAGDFHVFGLEWEPGVIRWLVDGKVYAEQKRWYSKLQQNEAIFPYPAPFDRDFFLKLNLAVGGSFVGEVDDSVFPAEMLIDWVKVYEKNTYPQAGAAPVFREFQKTTGLAGYDPKLKGTVRVKVTGLRSEKGLIHFSLYTPGDMNIRQAPWIETLTNGRSLPEAVFRNIPQGRYALIVTHDENGNLQLDRRPNGMPMEGYGVSGNDDFPAGPPQFEKSSFVFNTAETNITVRVFYLE